MPTTERNRYPRYLVRYPIRDTSADPLPVSAEESVMPVECVELAAPVSRNWDFALAEGSGGTGGNLRRRADQRRHRETLVTVVLFSLTILVTILSLN